MRLLLVVLLVAGLALPASADGCSSGPIDWVGTSPRLGPVTGPDSVDVDVVGQYAVWRIDDGEIASVEIPQSAVAVTVCADGVTFTLSEPVDRQPVAAQLIEDVDAATWRAFHPAGVHPL